MSSALLSVAQMNDADLRAMAGGVPGTLLMQRAGEAVARAIMRGFTPRPVAVLCGPGNNGGDGFVAATALAQAGWPVRLALHGDAQSLRGDAQHHAQRWSGTIEELTPGVVAQAGIVVDAVFGSGLSRRLSPRVTETLGYAARQGIPIIAVDVPSGVSGDGGEDLGATAAACTVTFMRKKPGHVLLPGRDLCGAVMVEDIGIPAAVLDSVGIDTWENDPQLWLKNWPALRASGNKYNRGHALLSGGYPMTGAARMAARAAARIGAGLTTIAVPEKAFAIYASALTSIMAQPLAQEDDFARLPPDRRYTALAIGPGAGVDDVTRLRALAMLASGKPVLLDADAISAFAGRTDELFQAINGQCVLTPHDGEFKRIFDPEGDKLTRTRRAARQSGAVIVLKGSDTVIAAPDGRAVVNSNAPATLATAGSGDVLAGMILGLLAQGMDAFPAASAGVWMHGAAASDFGLGLVSEDLPELLPAVMRRLAQSIRS